MKFGSGFGLSGIRSEKTRFPKIGYPACSRSDTDQILWHSIKPDIRPGFQNQIGCPQLSSIVDKNDKRLCCLKSLVIFRSSQVCLLRLLYLVFTVSDGKGFI